MSHSDTNVADTPDGYITSLDCSDADTNVVVIIHLYAVRRLLTDFHRREPHSILTDAVNDWTVRSLPDAFDSGYGGIGGLISMLPWADAIT